MKKIIKSESSLFKKISGIIEMARQRVATTANLTMVYTYYAIGKLIVEDEQDGNKRAKYGKFTLKELSEKLSESFGNGYSYGNLRNMRQFYLMYSEVPTTSEKIHSISTLKNARHCLADSQSETNNDRKLIEPAFTLSWSHYMQLIRIENPDERKFYEIESTKEQWSVRTLSRQINSSLYERLALSRNKKEVLKLSKEGNIIQKPTDILKDPLVLEFLKMEERSVYTESVLENAIINKMQKFLLELGKGFLFESRQRRFTFNEQHFFVDLVFYNRLLQCYVLVDLKIDKLTHQDLGQMQMYVNYFNRYVKTKFEKPTIGILLCKEKNDALVKLTLPEDANIYASEYKLYLPDAKTLKGKLKEWLEEFDS